MDRPGGAVKRSVRCSSSNRPSRVNLPGYSCRDRQDMPPNSETRQRILDLKGLVTEKFNNANWQELGLLTGFGDRISSHHRLLRSLYFGDEDYAGHVLGMLMAMVEEDAGNLTAVERYLSDTFGYGGLSVSSVASRTARIYFQPSVFEVPTDLPDPHLVSVMMPFTAALQPVYAAVCEVSQTARMVCKRADDVWENSTIIQDVFSLIYRSFIVVCDFSGRNPNVFYETGIAHTLGKHVIPISQSIEDVPFDLRHHRAIVYLNNEEGRREMKSRLTSRFVHLISQRGI